MIKYDCWGMCRERKAGTAYQKRHEVKKASARELEAGVAFQQQQSMAAAKAGKAKVKKLMARPSAEVAKNKALAQETTDLSGRVRAVQALKESIRGIFMQIKSANELHRYLHSATLFHSPAPPPPPPANLR